MRRRKGLASSTDPDAGGETPAEFQRPMGYRGGSQRGRAVAIDAEKADDVADAVADMITRDRRVAVKAMLVRAGAQTW